jgi:6-carboxyhexanoate--CoA ligase
MTSPLLYSVRMRASAGGRHLSGAERLVPAEQIAGTVQELVARARGKGIDPDQVLVNIDSLQGAFIKSIQALDLAAVAAHDVAACRNASRQVLQAAGVSSVAIENAVLLLDRGPSQSGNTMRGAMLMDAVTGERLEPDRERGVRVSRFDWSSEACAAIDRELTHIGLTHFRTREALSLASKVAHGPGVIAELCWSDDPDYSAGYASSLSTGYVRFPFMKQKGRTTGGRAFFVKREGFDQDALLSYLQEEPVIITRIGSCRQIDDLSDLLPDRTINRHV